jgi:hypothetical protein
MPEREKPKPKKFSYQMDEIQQYIDSIEKDGKGYAIQLFGPPENAFYDSFALLFFDNFDGGRMLIPVPTGKMKDEEIVFTIMDMKKPEDIDLPSEKLININEEQRCKLMSDCVFLNFPIAMIAFGESEKTRQKSAVLYVLGDNSPKEVYASMRDCANNSLKGESSGDFFPNNGQLN